MATAPRAKPEEFYSAEEWAALTARSSWRGLWLVAHCWGVICLSMLVGAMWPFAIPVVILIIGTRQLGLFILMHDAAHGLLHPDRRVNDRVGYWLCSSSLAQYRPYHLQHHRFVQQAEDPDLVLSAPFPITRHSFARKVVRDLTGQTFFKQRLTPLLQELRRDSWFRSSRANARSQELVRGGRFLLANAVAFAAFAAAGWWWVWLLMWLIPMATWLPLVSRIRNIAEHAMVGQDQADPLRQARTTHAGWMERALVAPYWVNYHLEHHLFTQVPCWNLPRAHALLRAHGTAKRMEIQPGYAAVLRLATSA